MIPIFNGSEYLSACLQSIMGQSFADIEVIAVNGGSTDTAVRRSLESYAERDNRLRVIHLGRIGPGLARNAGIQEARGKYIWFVDADDILPEDSLQVVADELGRRRPDVLIIDFEYLESDGRVRSSPGTELLKRASRECCTLVEQPWLLDLIITVWSKIIRTEFLRSTGLVFAPGIHEDVPFSCFLLLDASRICVLNRPCYFYRQGRHGAFMASTSHRHLDIFGAYRNVLDGVEARRANDDSSVPPAVFHALFGRAIRHYTTLLAAGGFGVGRVGVSGLIPRRMHRQYFKNMHRDFVRYRPATFDPGTGFRRMIFHLIERDRYWAHSALESAHRLRTLLLRSYRTFR